MHLDRLSVAELSRYGVGSLLILVLLGPAPLSAAPTPCQDPSTNRSAADGARPLGLEPSIGQWPTLVGDLLTGLASIWVQAAAVISTVSHQSVSEVTPLSWLIQQRLQGEVKARIREWSSGCVIPA